MSVIDDLGASIFNTFYTASGPKWFYYPVSCVFGAVFVALVTIGGQKYAEYFGTSYVKDIDAVKKKYNKPSTNAHWNVFVKLIAAGIDATLLMAYLPYSERIHWDINDIVFNFTWAQLAIHVVTMTAWIAFMMVLYDGQIYFFHRLEHKVPFLYRAFHVQHHENDYPASFWHGQYGDTIDNQIVAFFALWQVVVFPVSIIAIIVYLSFITFLVQIAHSGYHIRMPLLAFDSYQHLLHHQRRMCNYGEYTWFWDYLFGTLSMRSITLEAEVGPLNITNCKTE